MSPSPFHLPTLPLSVCEDKDKWDSFGKLEFRAVSALSTLDGMMQASDKADLFWLTWLLKEAQSSNVIEGTVTTFDEILGENVGIVAPIERQDDVREVINYRNAMQIGIEEIDNGRPLTLSFVKALHTQLLDGVRGEHKTPGQWRTAQVHIGVPGSKLESATYIPPEPFHILSLLENWEKFINRDDDLNPLVQAAVMHAQFEMIHPFLDGNGRMGRLLITLFLVHKKILTKPCFYISVYLQNNREEYYKLLSGISKYGDWNSWIKFFLNAVIERSNNNIMLLNNMNSLYERSKKIFSKITKSPYWVSILDYMFEKPLFTLPDLKNSCTGISDQGLVNIIKRLEKEGFVEKIAPGRGRSPAIWKFKDLMALLA